MRYNFDLQETEAEEGQTLMPTSSPSSSSTPTDELKWLPLQNHPVFSTAVDGGGSSSSSSSSFPMPKNLMAWDGASRLYFWDSVKQCLHRISIRLADPDPSSILAASPSKVMQPDVQLTFVVNKISINKSGSALLLVGSDGLSVMYLYGRTSTKDGSTICRYGHNYGLKRSILLNMD
ncbi:hypothetical protein CsSME_00028665 [Camellia sinensis var. sinensis]